MKKWWKLLAIALGAIVSGLLYRAGGWLQTKIRDLGCPLIALLVLWLFKGFILSHWWVYLITYGLMFGALTTYWKKKGEPARWWNWMLHGLAIGLAALPLIWIGVAWWVIVARALVLGVTMTLVSELSGNVWIEEIGRGVLLVLTVPLLLIG